jgi:putative two-component system response regulator
MLAALPHNASSFEQASGKKEIFLVDDEFVDHDIDSDACGPDYKIVGFCSTYKMFEAVSRGHRPSIIFLDTDLPDTDGFEALGQLKSEALTKNIPVVMITAKHDQASALKAVKSGAVDFVPRPYLKLLLPSRVALHLKLKDQQEVIKKQQVIIKEQALKLSRCRSILNEAVSQRTDRMSTLQSAILQTVSDLISWPIGADPKNRPHHHYLEVLLDALNERGLSLSDGGAFIDRDIAVQSARLHDVGKLAIETSIINKPGKLTAEEFEKVKKHTLLGVDMLERVGNNKDINQFLRYAKVFAGNHHEKWDGSGYPRGLRGDSIPMAGRVMAIADAYDGMTSNRPWKKPLSHEEAAREIISAKGTHFDPALIDVFSDVVDSFDAAPPPMTPSQGDALSL